VAGSEVAVAREARAEVAMGVARAEAEKVEETGVETGVAMAEEAMAEEARVVVARVEETGVGETGAETGAETEEEATAAETVEVETVGSC
jgi:hypothetical protein